MTSQAWKNILFPTSCTSIRPSNVRPAPSLAPGRGLDVKTMASSLEIHTHSLPPYVIFPTLKGSALSDSETYIRIHLIVAMPRSNSILVLFTRLRAACAAFSPSANGVDAERRADSSQHGQGLFWYTGFGPDTHDYHRHCIFLMFLHFLPIGTLVLIQLYSVIEE